LITYRAGRSKKLYASAQLIGQRLEIGFSVHAENESDVASSIPAVEMRGLGKIGVAAHPDALKTSLAAEGHHLVQRLGGVFMRGRFPLRLIRYRGSAVLASEISRG